MGKMVKTEEANSRIRKLEEIESQLLDWLKQTYSKQQQQYKNLEKTVKDGYNYYMQSYIDKKSKHDSQYPNTLQ